MRPVRTGGDISTRERRIEELKSRGVEFVSDLPRLFVLHAKCERLGPNSRATSFRSSKSTLASSSHGSPLNTPASRHRSQRLAQPPPHRRLLVGMRRSYGVLLLRLSLPPGVRLRDRRRNHLEGSLHRRVRLQRVLGRGHLRSPRCCLSAALSGIAWRQVAERRTVHEPDRGISRWLGDARGRPERESPGRSVGTLATD